MIYVNAGFSKLKPHHGRARMFQNVTGMAFDVENVSDVTSQMVVQHERAPKASDGWTLEGWIQIKAPAMQVFKDETATQGK